MEWMPGDQLRRVLPSLSSQEANLVAYDWGRCLARFHNAPVPEVLESLVQSVEESCHRYAEWSQRKSLDVINDLNSDIQWTAELHSEVEGFLRDRLDCIKKPNSNSLGLIKADQDVRDFLALSEPRPHISAMLDWEGLKYGNTLPQVTLVYLRLTLMDRQELWPAFRSGYEKEAGSRLTQNRQVEYFLLLRALFAARWNPRAYRIILPLVREMRVPFFEHSG